jgi:hypothetical protein
MFVKNVPLVKSTFLELHRGMKDAISVGIEFRTRKCRFGFLLGFGVVVAVKPLVVISIEVGIAIVVVGIPNTAGRGCIVLHRKSTLG